MDITIVGMDRITELLPLAVPFLQEAAQHSSGRVSIKSIVDDILAGQKQLWLITDEGEMVTAFVTQFMLYPTGLKSCDIVLLGGSRTKEWLPDAVECVSTWASGAGCSDLQVMGRPGWEKHLKGWGKMAVILVRPLGDYHG